MYISYGNVLWDNDTGDVDYIEDRDDPNDEYDPYERQENAEYWKERQ